MTTHNEDRSVVLLENRTVFEPKDSRTTLHHPFCVPQGLVELHVYTTYTPKYFEDRERSEELVRQCARVYDLGEDQPDEALLKEALSLSNLVVFSLDRNGEYWGAAHRHAPEQHILLSENSATYGFRRGAIVPGTWRASINVFVVLTDTCTYDLRIVGVKAPEERPAP